MLAALAALALAAPFHGHRAPTKEQLVMAQVDKNDGFTVRPGHHILLHTTKGDIIVAMFDHDSPKTAANFEKLVHKGFYRNTPFHRVIAGFMAQGGDPTGTGNGGPGYTIPYEKNRLKHMRGAIAMARTSDPNSAGSQFFIDFQRNAFLDEHQGPSGPDGYVVFGQVVKGMSVVDRLNKTMDQNDSPIPGVKPDKVLWAKQIN